MDSLPLEVIQRIPRFLPPKTFYAIIPLVSRGLLEATFNCIPGCRDRKLGINCTLRVMDRKRDSLAVGRSPGMEFTLVKNRRGTTWTGVNVDLHLGFRGVGRMIVGDHETLESLFLTRIRRSRTWLSNRRLKVVVSTVVFNGNELLKESQLQELDLALSYNRVVFQDFDSSEGENADARFKNMLELAGTIVGEPERLKTVNIFLSIWFEESDLYHAVRRRVWEEIWSDFKDTLDTMFKARSGFKGNCRFIFQDTRLDSYGLSKKKLSELLGEVVDLAARAGVTFISELQI
ncbi:hypothetical protein M427DRAFT_68298 [Gonapodya prolifera JEL478]|uniref:F-box domain-containing protein n=1 Tax=Gonapodya prolifera (strain JEL478) TaxID=1344416 RepID=A0A139AM11_GONPJ|nr:hypothetical protein M427DRAFT_68298 [Gonapodya prolifera JEL478]|eukprot:KXS17820.1 hypothetical protein M427DRAFT_68298 [Gonapodya prolifera JEL478]